MSEAGNEIKGPLFERMNAVVDTPLGRIHFTDQGCVPVCVHAKHIRNSFVKWYIYI